MKETFLSWKTEILNGVANKRKLCNIFFFLCFFLVASAYGKYTPPEIKSVKTDKAPHIDGVLDDECWKNAAEITDFILLSKNGKYRTWKEPDAKTKVFVCNDDENVYIAFKCEEPGTLRAKFPEHERDGRFLQEDCVEIFLSCDPEKKELYHFAVNPNGAMLDACGNDASWDAEWRAATSKTKDGWDAEFIIPLHIFAPRISQYQGSKLRLNCQRRRDGEHITWSRSPLPWLFQDPDSFGTLSMAGIDLSKYCFSVCLDGEVGDSTGFIPGENVKCRVRNLGNSLNNLKLKTEVYSLDKGKLVSINESTAFSVAPGQETVVPCLLKNVDRRNKLLLSLIDTDSARTLRQMPAFFHGAPMLRVVADLSYYTHEKTARIRVFPLIGNSTSDGELNFRIVDKAGRELLAETRPKSLNSEYSLDISRLPVGEYILQARLGNPAEILASSETKLIKLKSVANEVKIRNWDKAMQVNGELFFPMGWWFTDLKGIPVIKAGGWNTICSYLGHRSSYNDPSVSFKSINKYEQKKFKELQDYLDSANENGLKVIMGFVHLIADREKLPLDEVDFGDIKMLVRHFKEHPAILAWYPTDEPMARHVQLGFVEKLYNVVREEDPYHPIFFSDSKPSRFAEYSDIIGCHPYPVPHKPLTFISDCINKMQRQVDNQKPLIATLQAFTYETKQLAAWFDYPGEARMPTYEEIRCMTYLSLAMDAKGILYFRFRYSDPSIEKTNPELWEPMSALAKELKQFAPVFLSETQAQTVTVNSQEIYIIKKKYQGRDYLLTVNPTASSINAVFNDSTASVVDVEDLFSSKKITASKRSFSDVLEGFAVRLYQLK